MSEGENSLRKAAKLAAKSAKHELRKLQVAFEAGGPGAILALPSSNDTEEEPSSEVTPTPNRELLETLPQRCLQFLRAVGTTPGIRAALCARGYASEDHMEGWDLLHAVSGYRPFSPSAEDTPFREAIREIDAWEEEVLPIISATLRRRFPLQAEFVLNGFSTQASTEGTAVLRLKRLLERLDVLQNAPNRKDTQESDQAAVAILEQRGLDSEEKVRLHRLVARAEEAPDSHAAGSPERKRSDAQCFQGLVALRAWYNEWSSIARVVVKRCDHLILLGLARRHARTEPTPNGGAGP